MIAVLRHWSGEIPRSAEAVGAALEKYAPTPSSIAISSGLALLAGPRDHIGKAAGVDVAFCGWIDNGGELASRLGVDGDDPAVLYAAAVAALGAGADAQVVGNYAAIAVLPDATLRLARSPWSAPPLYYHVGSGRVVASPLMRVLFAAGVERLPDYERMIDELAYDWRPQDETAWHNGVRMVPLGAAVAIDENGRQLDRWYRAPAPDSSRNYDEAAAVSRASKLLDEAAAKALGWAGKPAVTLSGGLDSSLVTAALLDSPAAKPSLPAITFVPDKGWKGACEPGTMVDESGLAEIFARDRDDLEWHRASDDIGPPDRLAREVFSASEVFAPGLANVGMMHRVYETARALGCDSLLTADMGNATLSDSGRYAYCEYARRGAWGELVALLRNRPGDTRPLWRKMVALSLLPALPRWIRQSARSVVHPRRHDMTALLTPLSAQARAAQARRARARGTAPAWADLTHDRSREDAVSREFAHADGPGFDVDLAFEQLYGIRKRDVLAYRPLVEFCMSLPLEAFAREGVERRLARLVGKGRIPEAIRTNTLHGQHNADWHARMTPARAEMRATLEAARSHPFLGETLDIERLLRLVDNWPDEPTFSWEEDWPRLLALPRAMLAARYVGHVENRNDL